VSLPSRRRIRTARYSFKDFDFPSILKIGGVNPKLDPAVHRSGRSEGGSSAKEFSGENGLSPTCGSAEILEHRPIINQHD
jgi:hypothetical protein